MGAVYVAAAVLSLVGSLAALVSSDESLFGEILAAVMLCATGIFALACEVHELRRGPQPPKQVERPLLKGDRW